MKTSAVFMYITAFQITKNPGQQMLPEDDSHRGTTPVRPELPDLFSCNGHTRSFLLLFQKDNSRM